MLEERAEPFGGRADTLQIGQRGRGAGAGGALAQRVARRADAFQGWCQHATRRREIGCPCRSTRRGEHLIQQREERARIGQQGAKVLGELGTIGLDRVLEQHLGIADDVVQRRAELVTEVG